MKKILLFMAFAALEMTGCAKGPQPLQIDNALTPSEISAGVLTPEVIWKMTRTGSSSLSPDGSTLLYTITDYNMGENRGVTRIAVEDINTKAVQLLTDTSSSSIDPKWSGDGQTIYFLSARNGSQQLWAMDTTGGSVRQLSQLEKDVEGYDVNENGGKIWYVQSVQVCDRKSSDVHKDMPKSKGRIHDDLMARHWDYWDEGSYRHIFVADFDGKKLGEGIDILGADAAYDAPLAPYFDMTEIAWNNAGTELAYTCKPLSGYDYAYSTDSDIFVYNLANGKTTNICKPLQGKARFNALTHHKEPLPGYDKYPVWSPDDTRIAFRSMNKPLFEADKERLFVYDFRTGRISYLTKNFDYNAMNVLWDGNETIWFAAPIEATHQICRVPASGGDVQVITKGDHDIKHFSLANDHMVAERTTLSSATEFFDVNIADGSLTQLSQINKPIYDHIKMGEVQKRWVTTTDNKQMLVWVVLPPNFDPAKKYPTLLFCEGGPQSVVSQSWSYRWNFQLMAAQGYIVVAPNRRGLPSFGQEWLEQISGDYSGQNIKDYLSAIDDVSKEPWVDTDHRGCVGASYGGYSAYFLAGCHEGRFKAFISHCGIFNFDSMYGSTEELFFVHHEYGGAYWDVNNATAKRSYDNSPHKFVQKWDTPILIITGEKDFRIPYSQSLEAFTAARAQGIPARLVSFENEAHQVFQPQNSMVWNREFFGWLDKYLK